MAQIVPTVTVPVTPPEISAKLTPVLLGALARELAVGLREVPDILAEFNVSSADYEKLKSNEFFTKVVDLARIEWHGAANTANRLQLEAASAAEEALPQVYARAMNGKEPLNHVIDFMKWLADVGGLKKDPGRGQPGERFKITINLGADTKIEFDNSKAPLGGDGVTEPLALPSFDDSGDRV